MTADSRVRLYVQLQPDASCLAALQSVQDYFKEQGKAVSESNIHLTVIHFGIISDVLSRLPADDSIKWVAIDQYVHETQKIIDSSPRTFTLLTNKLGLFGAKKSSLAIVLEPTDELKTIHKACLNELERVLAKCGVTRPSDWMRDDYNFQYAREINPHITIIKGFNNSGSNEISPTPELPSEIVLQTMRLLY